uniref:Uncharacterized protein n=1 Tax=Pseudonaja textilis TaxID=8673 RepID=A0A670ZJN6_PSETE
VVVGVLTQTIGTWHRPVAYLSKQIDKVGKGLPACLRTMAGTAILSQEARNGLPLQRPRDPCRRYPGS